MLNNAAESGEADDVLQVAGTQQLVDHEQHEHGLHTVKRDPVPKFGEAQDGEAARMAEDGAAWRRLGHDGGGHSVARASTNANAWFIRALPKTPSSPPEPWSS